MIKTNHSSSDGLHQLIADIYAPQPTTLTCSQAERLIALAADNLLDAAAAQSRYPDLFLHLHTCENCTAVYAMMMEYARQEASGELPNPPRIPSLPAELRQASGGWASNLVRILFPGFAPATPSLALRGRLDLPPVTVALGDEGLQVELQMQPSSVDPDLRTLHCAFVQTGAVGGAESVTATLELQASGEVEQTQTGEISTDLVFLDIAPEHYRLHLDINDREYVIEELGIP